MRVASGIPGFDELIAGGFAPRTVNLLSGPAGSGKSLFGLQYIYNGAKNYGEKGIFVALEEPRNNIVRAAEPFGMSIEKAENAGRIMLVDFGEMRKDFSEKEEMEIGIIDFKTLSDFLQNSIMNFGAKRIVIDSITAVSLYYSTLEALRREMFKFCRFLKEMDVTSLLITESSEKGVSRFDVEQFVADSLIVLGYEEIQGEFRRTVRVYKMRFTKHDPYKHPFLITKNGIEVSEEFLL